MTDAYSAAPASTDSAGRRLLQRFIGTRELPLLIIIVVLMLFMASRNPNFLTVANFRAMAVGFTPTAIIAVGMVILLVSGGFDLSVGSVLALSGTLVARLVLDGTAQPIAILLVILIGGVVGLVNGWLITRLKINPLVATLGTLSIARGIAQVMTEGISISGLPTSFGVVGGTLWAGIPYMVLIMLVIVLIGDLALRHTRFLRQAYYVGSNENAARLSGISVDRFRIFAYVLTSALSAFAGILLASRLMAGTPTAAQGLELQVLAGSVIGGASLTGGEGTVLGAFLGIVFIGIVSNIMTMEAVSIFWQQAVTGSILVAAVAFDMLVRRRSA
ncbi:MAG: ABC transporter permease [Anaerolineae bacterium]|nr:ABC transporter permease [Anaerolineae bacterium]